MGAGMNRPADLPHFDGEPEPCEGENRKRLSKLLQRVWDLVRDGEWRTLRAVADACGCSESSASARLRDFRKVKIMGSNVQVVERRPVRRGLYEYRVENATAKRCQFSDAEYKERHGV